MTLDGEIFCLLWMYLPLVLADTRVNSDTGEVALSQQLIQLACAVGTLDEDDDLIKLQVIEKLVKLAILLILLKFDVVLLETVEGQFGGVINEQLKSIAHELSANWSNFLRKGSAEHHHLLVGGGGTEDLLNVTAHVYTICHQSIVPIV